MKAPYIPRYCRACQERAWTIHAWKREDVSSSTLLPFKCHSWRHEGECAKWKASQDMARVAEGLQKRRDWIAVTLTFRQQEWPDKTLQYVAGKEMWGSLRKRLEREYGKVWYVQTWERNRRGGAHVNVCIGNKFIRQECWPGEEWGWVKGYFQKHAMACGFGPEIDCKVAYDYRGLSAYYAKIALEMTGTVNKKDQVPWDAPRHFRRIRSSQKLLPPPHKNPDWTGVLHFLSPDKVTEIIGECEPDV